MRIELPEDPISDRILAAAFKVHTKLGPGLLEHAYAACLSQELRLREIPFASEVEVPLYYDGIHLDVAYRLDLLVEDTVIIEVKSVEKTEPIHTAQVLSYLRLTKKRVGLLLNFKVVNLKDGIKRIINGYESSDDSVTSVEPALNLRETSV